MPPTNRKCAVGRAVSIPIEIFGILFLLKAGFFFRGSYSRDWLRDVPTLAGNVFDFLAGMGPL